MALSFSGKTTFTPNYNDMLVALTMTDVVVGKKQHTVTSSTLLMVALNIASSGLPLCNYCIRQAIGPDCNRTYTTGCRSLATLGGSLFSVHGLVAA